MKKLGILYFLGISMIGMMYAACVHHPPTPSVPLGNFPKEIAHIFSSQCATAGCHNATTASGGIVMDTWENLFKGGNNGAVVIPFRSELSSLMYFINTDENRGTVAVPTMPVNAPPLSESEYYIIKNWIDAGAPDDKGNIPFATQNDNRQKYYVTQQGCDEVAVVDAASQVVMRSFKVGNLASIESPHALRVDQEGRYGYVCLSGGSSFQKFDTKTDAIVGTLDLGAGSWNAMCLSPDGRQALVVDWQSTGPGQVVRINTESMTVTQRYANPPFPLFQRTHGIGANKHFDTFYVTRQTGNSILKFTADGSYLKAVSLDSQPPNAILSSRDPHEVVFTPDYSKYFLTCESSNEVRVMDPYADTLIAAIPVGIKPQEFAIAQNLPYLYVSCMEDANPYFLHRGSVYVINYQTLQVVGKIYERMFQPHGLTVDEANNKLLVVSRNFDPNGPAPHHASDCGGRNGYYTLYDLQTFQVMNNGKKFEVLPDPYAADTRFK